MHCLYGLQQLGLKFELKGGTSLSKGHGIIHRFSEDIDIRIEPPPELHVKTGRNHTKLRHVESRRNFYDWLAKTIRIDGIDKVERDTAFDSKQLFSGGIRLSPSVTEPVEGLRAACCSKPGSMWSRLIPRRISAPGPSTTPFPRSKIIDNRARGVACYDPGYTLVETSCRMRAACEKAYKATSALYYAGKPTLDEILVEIGKWTDRLSRHLRLS